MTKTKLPSIYDTRKDFYGKAEYTREENDTHTIYTLYSYNTEVLQIFIDNDNIERSYYITNAYTTYSQTTLRHVKEFIHQFMNMRMNVYSILEYIGMTKNNIMALSGVSSTTVQEYIKMKELEKKLKKNK